MRLLYLSLGLLAGSASFAFSSDVTFHRDVEPILQKHCQECHRPGEIAPFSLLSYKDARPWAKSIRENVISKKMPPWLADSEYGHFSNDRSLTKEEIDTIAAWVDGGAKEGDAQDAPPRRSFVEGWNISQPDVVLSMSKPFHLPAKAEVPYQYLVLPTQFTEDKWITMSEVRPSNPAVVHHAVVFIRSPRSNWLRDAAPGVAFAPPPGDFRNIAGGGNELLTAYTPGKSPESWPPGVGKLIRAGSDLVLQIHYTPNGKETDDQIKIGLVFAKEKPTQRVFGLAGQNLRFQIPPGDPDYRVEARNMFPNGATILGFLPHMHLRGKAFEYRAVYPDGRTEVLLRVPHYDFFWQLDYKLTEPLKIPPGTRIECTAWYDNSANNPRNPDPATTVEFGEQSSDEMMFGFYDVVIPAGTGLRELFMPPKAAPTTGTGQ